MENLTMDQIRLLRSSFATKEMFTVDEFTFDCLEGEWLVTKNNNHIDVFSFSRMNYTEFWQTVNAIFYHTEKVTFN